jgi:hypothetical protein
MRSSSPPPEPEQAVKPATMAMVETIAAILRQRARIQQVLPAPRGAFSECNLNEHTLSCPSI